jgi:uncharacterized membrane protein
MQSVRYFFSKPWLYLVIIAFGIILKFYQLNKKLFWDDEIASVLYTTGQKISDIKSSIPANEIKNIGYYDSLLHLNTKTYSLKSQVAGIFSDTHLTPAHYAFLVVWYRIAGDTDIDYRLFSIFIFLLSLPFLFLLAKDLMGSNLAGWIATSLYSVSPFFNFKAQEARYYSLWLSVFIILNYFFLKAIRQNKGGWWVAYVLTAIIALYTSALSALFLFGHLIYVLYTRKSLIRKYVLLSAIIFLAYLPWMYFLYTVQDNIEHGLEWQKFNRPSLFTLDLLFSQLTGFIKSFVFFNDGYSSLLRGSYSSIPLFPLIVESLVLVVILYAFVYLKKAKREAKVFLLLIFLPLLLVIYITDVWRHAYTSFLLRYQITNMAAIGLVVANLLHYKIAKGKLLFSGIFLAFAGLGIGSILNDSENPCGDVRPDCPSNVQEAQIISGAEHPLVITDFSGWGFTNFLAVVNYTKTKKVDILYCNGALPDIQQLTAGKNYSEIIVMQSSPQLAQNIQKQFGAVMVAQRETVSRNSPQFWRIRPGNSLRVL